jgi:alkanesulfonate monooxygenase SsuD/methylene tetrahydromethanopterin reductase-like flavin-dependent oxidoreductase (luciferase family)
MLDCLSGGRPVFGFARGIAREYQLHHVPLSESRARFEEAFEIVTRAWTEEVFCHTGSSPPNVTGLLSSSSASGRRLRTTHRKRTPISRHV